MDMIGRIRRLHSRGKKSEREIPRMSGRLWRLDFWWYWLLALVNHALTATYLIAPLLHSAIPD